MSNTYSPVTSFDPNVWYHITEGRVDNYTKKSFQSSFQVNNVQNGTVVVYPVVQQHWQIIAVGDTKGRYSLRNHQTGVSQQLGVCYNPKEQAPGRTQACMRESNGLEEQMWDIQDWGDETFRFVNVANGTDYILDVHPGNPVFMNNVSNADPDTPEPAQHWYITSVDEINDGAYSTIFTDSSTESTPATATNDPESTATNSSDSSTTSSASPGNSSSSSGGLSTGAAAGIGIGVALGVIALAILGFFLWRRRRRNAAKRAAITPEAPLDDKDKPPTYTGQYYSPAHELATPDNVAEVQGNYHAELDSTPIGGNTMPVSPDSPEVKNPSPQTYRL